LKLILLLEGGKGGAALGEFILNKPMQSLTPEKLSTEIFSTYGEVIETAGHDAFSINSGNCQRYHDLASIDICKSGVSRIGAPFN